MSGIHELLVLGVNGEWTHQVLKDKEELIVFPDHLLKLHHTRVIQLTEGLDLAQRHALVPAEKLALHLLDGYLNDFHATDRALHLPYEMHRQKYVQYKDTHWVLGLHIDCLPHAAICAVS